MRINIKSSINFIKQHSKLTAGVTVGLLLGSAGSIAIAAIPDGNNAVHACYSSGESGTGAVRIIDNSSQSCGENETAISLGSAAPGNFMANMVGGDFAGADLRYRNFAGVDVHGGTFAQAKLTGADLHGSNLSGSLMDGATIVNANFSGVDLSDTHFNGDNVIQNSDFTGADFTNAQLYAANMGDSTVTDAIWSNTTCPDLNNSDYVGNTCVGHLVNQ